MSKIINKGNREIAEYIGYVNNYWYDNDELDYHESFDSIVPIIKRIDKWIKRYEKRYPKTVEYEMLKVGWSEMNIKKCWYGIVKWLKFKNQTHGK